MAYVRSFPNNFRFVVVCIDCCVEIDVFNYFDDWYPCYRDVICDASLSTHNNAYLFLDLLNERSIDSLIAEVLENTGVHLSSNCFKPVFCLQDAFDMLRGAYDAE